LEEQVQKLSNQLENESAKQTKSESSELEQLRSQLKAATDQLAQTRDENMGVLREQLNGTVYSLSLYLILTQMHTLPLIAIEHRLMFFTIEVIFVVKYLREPFPLIFPTEHCTCCLISYVQVH
jgi:hypothetical protein